jgi:CheY-like chemotaxis protein
LSTTLAQGCWLKGCRPMRKLQECRVLIVEDELLLAMDVEDTLRGAGCVHFAFAATVEDAIDKVHTWQPDVAILDLNLQGEKAFPVADLLDDAAVPFVIVTGHSRSILPSRHQSRPLLGKPCHPNLLLNTLEHMVSAPGVLNQGRS